MNRLLNYLFAAFFLFGSMQVSAGICSDMHMDDNSKTSQQDVMQDCHSDQQAQKSKSDDNENYKQCCDNDCASCPHFNAYKEPGNFSLISHFLEPVNDKSFNTISTFYKILIPPPIA